MPPFLVLPNSTYLHTENPQLHTCKVNELKSLRNNAGVDRALLTLDLHTDLRSVFNWNVKQLFVYVTAEYETDANVLNQVVVWDTIINDSPSVRAPVERSPGQRALARVAPPRAPCRATVLPTDAADTVTTRF